MAESKDDASTPERSDGVSQVQAVSQLLQAAANTEREGSGDDAPGQRIPEGEQSRDDAGQPDDVGEIRTDDLGLKPPADSGDTEKSAALNDLAEKAGVSIEDIYKIEIGMPGDSSPVSLGTLKDSYQTVVEQQEKSDAFEAHRTAFENDMIKTRAEMQTAVALLGDSLPPAFIAHVRQTTAERVDRERATLLAVKPEWSDDQKFHAAREEIIGAVDEYGVTRAEVESQWDHRLIKLLWDFAQMKKRIGEAATSRKKLVKEHNTGGRQTRRTPAISDTRKTEKIEAAKGGTEAQQLTAIAGLIKDG